MRTVGANETAAVYAGIDPRRITLLAMCLSGALAGFLGINEVMGVHHRLLLNFTAGYGFTGIAVALMGRNHPLGLVLEIGSAAGRERVCQYVSISVVPCTLQNKRQRSQ